MDTALEKKFPNEQRITIRNPQDKRVITRPWLSAKHLVDKGWIIQGSEANSTPKKSLESEGAGTVPKAETVVNNFDMFTEDELKAKYKDLYDKKPFHKWGKTELMEKIKTKLAENATKN